LAFSIANGSDAPVFPLRLRSVSPSGGSILMTSAPAIAIRKVQ
jgi:hypothetical protein